MRTCFASVIGSLRFFGYAKTLSGSGLGPQPSFSFNAANNQIANSGYTYDAAGNMTYDGSNSYTYNAEGNVTAVTGNTSATYTYNALNQRVRTVASGTTTEYVFNSGGQRVSEWNAATHAQLKGKYYWGGKPVAYYSGGATHFEHQDWLGTERMRTAYNGGVEGTYSSLPWGDGQSSAGADTDANHYAQLDHDTETNTDHADFRQYSNAQGRWMSPDPYSESYDGSNPQSMNRYEYALNSPLGAVDPSGEDQCTFEDGNTYTCWQYDASYNGVPPTNIGVGTMKDLAGNYLTTPCSLATDGTNAAINCGYSPSQEMASELQQYMKRVYTVVCDFTPNVDNPCADFPAVLMPHATFGQKTVTVDGQKVIEIEGDASWSSYFTDMGIGNFMSIPTAPDLTEKYVESQILMPKSLKSCPAAATAIASFEKLNPGIPLPANLLKTMQNCAN